MRVVLELEIETEFFDIEEAAEADALAISRDGRVYTWKTVGRHNWLERGFSLVDSAGLVVLPVLLPDRIKMCDDQPDTDGFTGRDR